MILNVRWTGNLQTKSVEVIYESEWEPKFASWSQSGCKATIIYLEFPISLIDRGYHSLVYTTQVNSAFRAIWLVPQSRDIKYYSPLGGFRVKKMSRETHFIRKWSNLLGIAIKLVLYILKQLFASVSVISGGYLPRRSGSVNIHRYSPPLLRIIVKYQLWFFRSLPNNVWPPQQFKRHLKRHLQTTGRIFDSKDWIRRSSWYSPERIMDD